MPKYNVEIVMKKGRTEQWNIDADDATKAGEIAWKKRSKVLSADDVEEIKVDYTPLNEHHFHMSDDECVEWVENKKKTTKMVMIGIGISWAIYIIVFRFIVNFAWTAPNWERIAYAIAFCISPFISYYTCNKYYEYDEQNGNPGIPWLYLIASIPAMPVMAIWNTIRGIDSDPYYNNRARFYLLLSSVPYLSYFVWYFIFPKAHIDWIFILGGIPSAICCIIFAVMYFIECRDWTPIKKANIWGLFIVTLIPLLIAIFLAWRHGLIGGGKEEKNK